MDRLRTAWIVVFVAGVAIGRYVLPRASAEARPITVTREVVREAVPQPTRVLTEVLRCATALARDSDPDTGDFVDDDAPGDGDGLTDEQRWEGVVAELEDALPRDRGAIQGQVHDDATGEPLAGVTVVVTGPDMEGAQTAITDERGFYMISDLPTGNRYLTTFYYLETTVERTGVVVGARKVSPVFQRLATSSGGPTIAPEIGITIDDSYIRDIPVVIEGFSDGDEAAPGESLSSNDTLENIYIVEE